MLDLSDPQESKDAGDLQQSHQLLPDGGHGLIYLTNDEGLWILRYNHPALSSRRRKNPLATQSSEIQAMPPDCD